MMNYKVIYFSYLMLTSERAKFHFKICVESGIKESDSGQLKLEFIVVVPS